jgi:hypothetical protein
MASTFTDLGIEIMATGENAGTWGDKTNTNLSIVNAAVAGYVEQAVTNGGTLALTITDGAATATLQNAVIKLTGTITGNSIVTIPDSIEKTFIVTNGTSGAYTVQFKTVSGTGVTFSTTDKGTKFVHTDGTNVNEISSSSSETLTSSGNLTLDAGTDIILDADGGDVFFKDNGTTFGSATNTSGNLILKSGTTTALTFSGANVTAAGNLTVGGNLDVTGTFDMSDAAITNVGSIQLDSIAGDGDTNTSITFSGSDVITIATGGSGRLTIGDGALSPVTDNEIDLGTSSLEFKDGYFDGTVTADAFAGPLTGNVTGNVSGTAATVTTAAQSNITSLGTLTTLTVDNVIINGSTIGHTGDTDLITVASGIATVAGEVSMTTLDIGGTNVTSTAAELNIIDGGTSATSTTLADADRVVVNDNGTMVQVAMTDVKAYVGSAAGAFSLANLDIDGATDIGADIVDADLFIVDDGAGGTNRKTTAARLKTYTNADLADPTALAIALG